MMAQASASSFPAFGKHGAVVEPEHALSASCLACVRERNRKETESSSLVILCFSVRVKRKEREREGQECVCVSACVGNPSQGSSHTISHPHISVPSQANTGQGTNPLAALWTNFTSSPAYSPYNRHTCSPPRQTARARSGTSAAAASAHAATAAAAALRVPRVRVVDPSASQRSNTTPHHTYLTTNGHQLTHPPNPLQYTHGGVAGGVAGMGMAGADMLSFDGPYGNVPGTYVFYNSGSGSGGGSGGPGRVARGQRQPAR